MGNERFRADSLGFAQEQGQHPVFTRRPGVSLIHLTTARPFVSDFDQTLDEHKKFLSTAKLNPNLRIVLTREDLATLPADAIGLLLGIQHAPANMNLERMLRLKDLGLRVVSIAYSGSNEYGHGYAEDGGLTRRGEDLLIDITQCGMILDLSHANNQTASEALNFIKNEELCTQVMASHSGCNSVYRHRRNLSDYVLKGIADMSGYVGIPLITFLLGEEGSDPYRQLVSHARHARLMIGVGNVGIGSDCMHQDRTMLEAEEHYKKMLRMFPFDPKLRMRFPDRPEGIIERGSVLFDVLEEKLGRNDEFFGKNFRNFLLRALPEAQ